MLLFFGNVFDRNTTFLAKSGYKGMFCIRVPKQGGPVDLSRSVSPNAVPFRGGEPGNRRGALKKRTAYCDPQCMSSGKCVAFLACSTVHAPRKVEWSRVHQAARTSYIVGCLAKVFGLLCSGLAFKNIGSGGKGRRFSGPN